MPGYEWSGDCAEDPSQCDEDGFSLWNHRDGAIFFPDDDAHDEPLRYASIPSKVVKPPKTKEEKSLFGPEIADEDIFPTLGF